MKTSHLAFLLGTVLAIPLSCKKTLQVELPPALENIRYEIKDTLFHTERDGMRIYGKLVRPEGVEGRLPLVICCHGLYGHYTDCMPYAEEAARKGMTAYCFDFCGGSMASYSGGSNSQMSIFTEQADLHQVIRFLKTQEDVDSTRVFLAGASQGGMVCALEAAAQREKIKGLVLLFPAFNIPDMIRTKFSEFYPDSSTIPDKVSYGGFTFYRPYWEPMLDFDPYQIIGDYEGPVLIQHGNADPLVPLSYSQKAARTYGNARLEVLKKQPHGFIGKGFDESVRQILDFLFKNKD